MTESGRAKKRAAAHQGDAVDVAEIADLNKLARLLLRNVLENLERARN